jgi:hypothetical protein
MGVVPAGDGPIDNHTAARAENGSKLWTMPMSNQAITATMIVAPCLWTTSGQKERSNAQQVLRVSETVASLQMPNGITMWMHDQRVLQVFSND